MNSNSKQISGEHEMSVFLGFRVLKKTLNEIECLPFCNAQGRAVSTLVFGR